MKLAFCISSLILLASSATAKSPVYALHESITQFSELKLLWETDNYLIRIDDMGNNSYRYAVWPLGSAQAEEPDLILYGGSIIYFGSGGNHHYEFTNNEYTYRCHVHYLTDGMQPPGTLEVYRYNEIILEADVTEELYNSLFEN